MLAQKRAPPGSSAPQEPQVSATRAPHPRQNLAWGGLSCWHRGHVMPEPSPRVGAGTGRTGGESLVSRTGGVKDRGGLPSRQAGLSRTVHLTPQAFCVTSGTLPARTPSGGIRSLSISAWLPCGTPNAGGWG